jgi:hypothetical protein
MNWKKEFKILEEVDRKSGYTNGDGYYQQDLSLVNLLKDKMMAEYDCVNFYLLGRILDDSNDRTGSRYWTRLYCINPETGKEYGQPFFAINPDKVSNDVCLNIKFQRTYERKRKLKKLI